MRRIKIFHHPRGNHSVSQIVKYGIPEFNFNRGSYIFSAKEAKEKLVKMRKFCRNDWPWVCTDLKMRDYIAYEMADIFAVDIDKMEWF